MPQPDVMRHFRPSRSLAALATSVLLFAGCQQSITATPTEKPAPASTAVGATSRNELPDFTALVKAHGPAVVNISSTRKLKWGIPLPEGTEDPIREFLRRFGFGDMPMQEFQSRSLGSGFVIDADGHILTNAHVVEGADEVTVGLTDKREFKARVIGSDERTDVALLKISASNLPYVKIGDPAKLNVGEWVVAIGAPFGFTNSVTQGIVSATGRSLPGESIVPFIQTDAAVNPGNSGGPLFNMAGEVIGINSQIYSRSGGSMGVSFAIPIDLAIKVKDALLKHGAVRRGKLGVAVQDVSQDLAESFGLAKATGALVTTVEKGSAADQAGLQMGDIVLTFNGKALTGSGDLARAVAETAPGATARLEVWRQGARREISVRIGNADGKQRPGKAKAATVPPDALGLGLRDLSRGEQKQLAAEGTVIVESVEGVAASAGLQPGDIILSINNQLVSSVQQVRSLLDKADKRAALLVQRDRDTKIFIPIRLKGENE
jgi:serine protease Do